MAEQYLLPEDSAPSTRKQVLDFLNQAASAGDREKPSSSERAGRRSPYGQRIITRRNELGGFSTLD